MLNTMKINLMWYFKVSGYFRSVRKNLYNSTDLEVFEIANTSYPRTLTNIAYLLQEVTITGRERLIRTRLIRSST